MMTTIKRTIVILILLAIAFFIYRGVSPTGAERLIARIKAIPTMLGGSGVVLSGTETSITGQFLELTGDILITGNFQETGLVDILSGMDSFDVTGDSSTTVSGSSVVKPTTPVKTPSSPTTTTKGLSSKDIKDTEAISNLFQ